MTQTLLLGTRKGIFSLSSTDRRQWSLEGPSFLGHIIQHLVADPREPGRVVAGMSAGHLGPTVSISTDGGGSWKEASRPPAFRSGEPLGRSLSSVFWLTPGHVSQPGRWYAGGSPQGLFRSDDGGDTWETVYGWNDHPLWETWAEWPEQNTPDGSMLHSVNIDPRDPAHLYIGLSSGGVFETADGGSQWAPLNRGSVSPLVPDGEDAEFGQDPHCVRIHPQQPDRLYQQNHCGIYRMDRADACWVRVGNNMPSDVGDIGFPIEMHPRDPNTVWVFPMDGTDVWPRTSPGGRPAVYRSRDAGESWTRCDRGLPVQGWFTVKRQAMCVDGADSVGVYFGTTSGEVWASADEGQSWTCITAHLPEIYSLEYADL